MNAQERKQEIIIRMSNLEGEYADLIDEQKFISMIETCGNIVMEAEKSVVKHMPDTSQKVVFLQALNNLNMEIEFQKERVCLGQYRKSFVEWQFFLNITTILTKIIKRDDQMAFLVSIIPSLGVFRFKVLEKLIAEFIGQLLFYMQHKSSCFSREGMQ